MDQLKDLLDKKEPLDPELEKHIVDDGPLGPMLKHPLVYSLVYSPEFNAQLNASLKAKKKYIEEQKAAGEFKKVLFMYERPYRIEQLFLYVVDKLDKLIGDKELQKSIWDMLWYCWTDTENFWQYRSHMKHILNVLIAHGDIYRSWDLEDDDDAEDSVSLAKRIYDSLPEKITIYRGHQAANPEGFSWTLSPYHAQWFANRFNAPDGSISVAEVKRDAVLNVLTDRNEMEIAVLPHHLDVRGTLNFEWPFRLQHFVDIAKKAAKRTKGIHGEFHWFCVYRNAMALCDHYPEVNRHVCELFAIFHDCCRLHDGDDPEHGPRAAAFIEGIRDQIFISDEEFKALQWAMRHHTHQKKTKRLIGGICFDADRLDLTRDGKMPENQYLSTKAARKVRWTV